MSPSVKDWNYYYYRFHKRNVGNKGALSHAMNEMNTSHWSSMDKYYYACLLHRRADFTTDGAELMGYVIISHRAHELNGCAASQ